MKITDSLEKVYTAMGGTDEFDKSDIANGIDQISEVASSGGGGGTGGMLVANMDRLGRLDKTLQQIFDAPCTVIRVLMPSGYDFSYVNSVWAYDGDETEPAEYGLSAFKVSEDNVLVSYFTATSRDAYPIYAQDSGGDGGGNA